MNFKEYRKDIEAQCKAAKACEEEYVLQKQKKSSGKS